MAETQAAGIAFDRFIATYRARYSKAVDDPEVLLTFTTSRPSTGYTCAPPPLSIESVFQHGAPRHRPDRGLCVALPYDGKNVLLCGLGAAGYMLSHYLLIEGFGVADDPVGSCEAAYDLACRHLA
jgi:hypothetical protein